MMTVLPLVITGNGLYDGTFTLDRINPWTRARIILRAMVTRFRIYAHGAKIRASTETTMPTFTSAARKNRFQ